MRIQRLKAVRGYSTDISNNTDVINPSLNSKGGGFGTSKTRRESSKWTDYLASQEQSYIVQNELPAGKNSGIQNFVVSLNCNCGAITNGNKTLVSKASLCPKCKM